jgi:hypothetical protein
MSPAPPLVVGNLDCEARWRGAVLPRRVLDRISAAATLVRFLFDERVSVWTPTKVAPSRIPDFPDAPAPVLHTGPLPRAASAGWGAFRESGRRGAATTPGDRYGISIPTPISIARIVNDRRFAASLATQLGIAPAGAIVIESVAGLRRHLANDPASASPTDQWICKAPLSAAGRDRVIGQGRGIEGELERALTRLLQRFSALSFEPWFSRTCDLGVCAIVRPDEVVQRPAHTLITTPRGGFCGISLHPPPLSPAQRDLLIRTVTAAGDALRDAGYLGPFNIDAFIHRDRGGQLQLRALCEINARLSFGWIAAALADRYGVGELQFAPPPPGATVLVDADADGIAAWIR